MGKLEKLLAKAQSHLDHDEEICTSVLGAYETKMSGHDTVRKGSLIAADHRVVFYAKKLGGYELESFPYDNISSIEMGKQLIMATSSACTPLTTRCG